MQVGTRDNNVVKLVSQLGTAVLQLCCVVDRTADLCSAFSSTIQLGAINRFCQVRQARLDAACGTGLLDCCFRLGCTHVWLPAFVASCSGRLHGSVPGW